MDYWKGPHSKIISATPGFEEYRQIHLAENNPGLWPAIGGVETVIPSERRIDGVAEVTFASALSPLRGRKQTRLAYKDEVNVFRRTLLYAGPPRSARWYDVARPEEKVGRASLIYLRKREGIRTRAFRRSLTGELVPALAGTGALRELRTQVFMPWNRRLWNTPNVAHDNPTEQHFHASLILGFTDAVALRAFYGSEQIAALSGKSAGVRLRCPRVRSHRGADLREGRHRPSALSGIAREARATVGVPASAGRRARWWFTAPDATSQAPRSPPTFVGASPKPVPNRSPDATQREPGPRSACPSGSRGPLRATRLASPSLRRRCSVVPVLATKILDFRGF